MGCSSSTSSAFQPPAVPHVSLLEGASQKTVKQQQAPSVSSTVDIDLAIVEYATESGADVMNANSEQAYVYAYDLKQWPEFRGPSSRVVKEPKDWCDASILGPHEAFRWLHNAIREILANFDPLEPGKDWKTAVFFKWLQRYYIEALHHHHDAEENIYNSAIVEKGGQLPDKITADHKEIIEGLEKCGTFRAKIEAGDEAALVAFKAHLSALIDMVDEHLAEEEEAYPSALRSSSMTEEEEKKVVMKIIQSIGLDGNKVLSPPVIYTMYMWAGKEKVESTIKSMPLPIRMAFSRSWLPDFRANNLGVIRVLQGTDEFKPKSTGCGIFKA